MANFNPTIITNSGLSLISRLVSGSGQIKFTRICTSKSSYSIEEAQGLENLKTIEQSADVSKVEIVNNTAVKVSATITNKLLEVGYYINAIGLYAEDPDFGEILYSITIAKVPDWMQPDSGSGTSSLLVQLITQVSNASIVQIEVNPSVLATMQDIKDLQDSLSAGITSAQNAAETAQTTASSAKTAADNAQATADTANTTANAAKTAAANAQTTANNAAAAATPTPKTFSVSTSSWSTLTTAVAGRTYKAIISATGITTSDFPDIYFDTSSIESATTADIIADTTSDSIILYAKTKPTATVSGSYFIRKG